MQRSPSPAARRSGRGALLAAAVACVLGGRAPQLAAQPAAPAMAGMAHHGHGNAPAAPLTAAARAQLDSLRRATAALATPEAARAAGFRPVFGNVPLQGEHYVRMDRVTADTFDLARPSVLLFAPVAGRPTLVGVAYAMLHPTDAPPPASFDGVGPAAWHTHDGLAQMPGRHLVMMHAWFVDAPGGAFARDNPWLPYLAAGLAPPSAAELADSARGERARRLGLALSLAQEPPVLLQWIARQGGDALRARLTPHRDAITALVPRLAAAERAGDAAARARIADEAVRHGGALLALYRDAVPGRPVVARLVDATADEFLGRGHGVEEALGALRAGR